MGTGPSPKWENENPSENPTTRCHQQQGRALDFRRSGTKMWGFLRQFWGPNISSWSMVIRSNIGYFPHPKKKRGNQSALRSRRGCAQRSKRLWWSWVRPWWVFCFHQPIGSEVLLLGSKVLWRVYPSIAIQCTLPFLSWSWFFVKNGCISNSRYLSNMTILHFHSCKLT